MENKQEKAQKAKKEKKKTIYIDDGSSFADMSAFGSKKKKEPNLVKGNSFKEQFKTFTDAQKMMFLPMLAVLGIIAVAFLLVYILL